MEKKQILNQEQAEAFAAKLNELNDFLNTLTGHEFELVTLMHPVHKDDEQCHGVSVSTALPIGEAGLLVEKGLMTLMHHFALAQQAFSTEGLTKQ